MELLLDVWREACRHLAVEDAFERIAELVGPRIPADLLVVRRVDAERRRIETVPAGQGEREGRASVERTECSAQQLDELLRWARRGTMLRCGPPAKHPLVQVIAPRGIWGDVIAGPLLDDERLIGLLVAAVASPRQFTADHEALLRRLLEPCAMALVNDARWHELVRLREASEADRRALLSRLERDTIADTIVGADAGLRQVMERVEQVAPTDAPVLLLGETGTGKEVIARAIHARSRRAGGPVVRVNCGAIPPGLIDSELFGHVRGSFTGAVAERKGWFERADGGTLFLDEVAELPLDAQVRLLRILQDGTYERVGGQRTLQVDVRIVAATHRDLRERVADGSFREDLWYRINVVRLTVPPLCERAADIPLLVHYFLKRYNASYKLDTKLTDSGLKAMEEHGVSRTFKLSPAEQNSIVRLEGDGPAFNPRFVAAGENEVNRPVGLDTGKSVLQLAINVKVGPTGGDQNFSVRTGDEGVYV